MRRVSILLIVSALVAAMVGCGGDGDVESYTLSIVSAGGGRIVMPGEGTFTYDEGTVVNLVAEAEYDYQFVGWSGDVGTIDNVYLASTTIIIDGDYSITANFGYGSLSLLRRMDLADAQGLMISTSSTIGSLSTDSSDPINRLDKYTEDGNLEIVTMYDEDGNAINYTSTLSPTEIIDLGSKLFISFNARDTYSCPLSQAVFIDKSNGNAYMIADNLTGSIILHHNPCYAYRQIYGDANDNIYIYIEGHFYTNGATSGFYKITFDDSGANGELLFAFDVDCNNPTFLADRHGNIAYEDSCKPWKIFTAGGRMSTVPPDTFGYGTLLSSQRFLINDQLMLNSDGMSTTQYTNTQGICAEQSNPVAYGANMTYVANGYGVIVYDEISSDLDENVMHFYPDNWSGDSRDYNSLVVANGWAYIATNVGIMAVSLSDIDDIVWQSNILDDVYKVTGIIVHSDHIVFNGKDPYLNNVTGRYDFDTGNVTIIENYGKEDFAFNLIMIS